MAPPPPPPPPLPLLLLPLLLPPLLPLKAAPSATDPALAMLLPQPLSVRTESKE